MFNAQLKTEKCKLKFVFYVDNVGRKVYVSCDSNPHIRQTYKHLCYNYARPICLVRANGSLLSLKYCYLYVTERKMLYVDYSLTLYFIGLLRLN